MEFTSNVGRVAFDPSLATVKGSIEPVTTGAHDFAWFDVTRDGRAAVIDSVTKEMKEVLSAPGENLTAPRLAADAGQLYFLRQVASGDVWMLRLGTSVRPR